MCVRVNPWLKTQPRSRSFSLGQAILSEKLFEKSVRRLTRFSFHTLQPTLDARDSFRALHRLHEFPVAFSVLDYQFGLPVDRYYYRPSGPL